MTTSKGNELLELFTRCNEDLWPLHLVAYGLGVAAAALLFARPRSTSDRLVAAILAILWLWLGAVFQAGYATDVDVLLGTVYALMFLVQAYLLFRHGVIEERSPSVHDRHLRVPAARCTTDPSSSAGHPVLVGAPCFPSCYGARGL